MLFFRLCWGLMRYILTKDGEGQLAAVERQGMSHCEFAKAEEGFCVELSLEQKGTAWKLGLVDCREI